MRITLRGALFLSLLCIVSFSAKAQFDFPATGARSAAMGGATVGLDDFWSATDNIAGTAFLKHSSAGLSYQQNHFVKELPYLNIAGNLLIGKNGAALLHYTYHGTAQYNEQQASGGYAMKVTPKMSLGVTVNYLHSGCNDPHYDPQNHLTCALGVQYRPSERCIIGAKVFNPLFLKSGNELVTDHLPVMFNVGIGYQLTTNCIGTVEIEKNIYQKPMLRIGAEYRFWEILYCRAGFTTQSNCYGLGLGIHHKHLHADIAAQMHPVLGLSPVLSVIFDK